ncbi:16S rRNA (cytidine(1402)-2'-O)-methyltransferase [Mycoplasma procyoni]|uniref:16S rRNA (cytidine(1402)-2'-O)-methyltransferase n=1 Tax=Mycoplasma procyoni TaxID=568784 RepID=UPI00197C1817|nr:16S rRNA (cytidine(1402)-2'-O)-methyltransferase [Mycoplasma procyoni]MBN3534586.1 16S rRNA (cytidine(1402)-2'-O)-methyltransferase [Mycoplasma procyoni]
MEENKIYIVGTPIGNLEDITLRAIKTLNLVDVILCEDTRVTQKLLNHLEIKNKKLISYHKFNEKEKIDYIFSLFEQNQKIALVSDAGMPKISDPGFILIEKANELNIKLEIIPGPNAAISSFVLSPFYGTFSFLGFLKDKSSQRQKELAELIPGNYIIYVSPHKLIATLEDLDSVFGDQVDVFLSKEITKMFEKHFLGNPKEILAQLPEVIKGEYTLCFKIKQEQKIKQKVNKYQKFSKAQQRDF